jgi:hypothetical protein
MPPDTFSLCPPEETLCFTRGDTFVWERVIKDENNVIVDITGFAYELTVDSLEDPIDALTNIFAISGSVPVGTDGRVLFQFSVANWAAFTAAMGEPPVSAFYDLEQTDAASNLRTVRKGEFQVEQDINK